MFKLRTWYYLKNHNFNFCFNLWQRVIKLVYIATKFIKFDLLN